MKFARSYLWPISFLLKALFRLTFDTIFNGAANPLVCAAALYVSPGPDAEGYKGAYTHPISKIVTPSMPPAKSKELAKEFYDSAYSLWT